MKTYLIGDYDPIQGLTTSLVQLAENGRLAANAIQDLHMSMRKLRGQLYAIRIRHWRQRNARRTKVTR